MDARLFPPHPVTALPLARRARRDWLRTLGLLAGTAAWSGCSRSPQSPSDEGPSAEGHGEGRGEDQGPEYVEQPGAGVMPALAFAIHPLHNPQLLWEVFSPVVRWLNREVPGIHLGLLASRDYPSYDRRILAAEPEYLLPNPYQTLLGMERGYGVIAKLGNDSMFRGLFLVRRDSPLRSLDQLRGKVLAYPAKTALAACMMPQWALYQAGLDVNRDVENRYVGSQESAILNVADGLVDVGVTWPPPWINFLRDRPEVAVRLRVLAVTESLPNNSIMARRDQPLAVRTAVAQALARYHLEPEAASVLARIGISRFDQAVDADYQPVRRFLVEFERQVRPAELPLTLQRQVDPSPALPGDASD